MKPKTNKHPSTGRQTTAAKQAGPPVGFSPASDWWLPQLDTPVGRIELVIRTRDQIRVRRAGWMELYAKSIKWPRPHCRDTRFGPPYLAARCQTDLTPHLADVALARAADGSWKPAESYRARRDREIAQMLADAVTAWMAVEPAEKDDLLRRATALDNGLTPLWTGPVMALAKCADRLSSEVERGFFDFDDAGQVRNLAMQAAEHLRKMMVDVVATREQLMQAIAPTTKDQAAA